MSLDTFIEEYELSLPGAITIHPAAIQSRDSSLMGIEAAFEQRKIDKMDLSDLGISSELVGENGSPTKVISINRIKRERKCEFIAGSVEEQADHLIQKLKESGLIN